MRIWFSLSLLFIRDVLQQKELEPHIKIEALGPLLPDKDLKLLEELYLSHKEVIPNSSIK